MKAKTFTSLMALFLIATLNYNCKKEVVSPIPPETLEVTILDEFTTLPAKVSIFFKVETKEGAPIANLEDKDFFIFEKGINDERDKVVSIFEADRQISPNSQVFTYNTLLVLDLSGSVLTNSLEALKEASKQFIGTVMPEEMDSSINMGIFWFDGEDVLHELIDLTPNAADLEAAIEGITSDISSDSSTDLYGAILKSTEKAEAILLENQDIITATSIVIFTDGTDQAGRYSQQSAIDAINNADEKIFYYTIGLGDEIDEEILGIVGKNSSAFADNLADLTASFENIAQFILDQANSFYLFEYCSPKRAGINDLRIKTVLGDDTGSVTTTFDATGFGGGCEL